MSIIIKQNIEEEFKNSFLSYAMSVITDRALPDVRDGLKPVHRRIIYDMNEMLKLKSDGKYVKSARIVGDVIGKLHPHGDSSVYDAACRLTLDYVMRYPLIDGQGNFGSTDGDGAAAQRYTEMRPAKLMSLITDGVKKNTVRMVPTFDDETLEPEVLPGLFPNLLCNPTSGIAVGESCNFVPHNLTEVCNGIIAYIKNNNITLDEIMTYIPGPDFPLGGIVINDRDIKEAYKTGKTANSLRVRGDYNVNGNIITFTSIPFGASRSKIKEQINKSVNLLEGLVSDFNDNTNRNGINIVFELENGVKAEDALRVIFKETELEKTCPINNVCLINGTTKQAPLLELIDEYVKHQNNIIINAAIFDKEKAEARVHILEGLLKALTDIDAAIKVIRASKDKTEARSKLMSLFAIDEIQANAILDMKLSRLTKLDEEDLKLELEKNRKIITHCTKIITDKLYRDAELISKITKMRDTYGDARRTKLENIPIEKVVKAKSVIPATPIKVDFVKPSTLKVVKGAKEKTINTKLNSHLVAFSNKGIAYKIAVEKIGTAYNLVSELKLSVGEVILKVVDIESEGIVYQTTKNGMIKLTKIEEYQTTRAVQSIKLKEGDEVIAVDCGDFKYITQVTATHTLSFDITDLAITGRTTLGIKGIKLNDGEYVTRAFFSNNKPITLGKRGNIGTQIK